MTTRFNPIVLGIGLFFIVVVLFCYFVFSPTTSKGDKNVSSNDYTEIRDRGFLKVITDYTPSGYYVQGDSIQGLNYILLNLISRRSGLEMQIALNHNLENNITDLQNGIYDLIAHPVAINSSLKDSVNFTVPVVQNKFVLVQRKKKEDDKMIRSLLDLANETIYVAKSSPAIFRLQNLSHEIGDTIYIQEDELYGAEQLMMKVESGEIDYAVCEATVAAKTISNLPSVDINTDIGFTHLEAWIVSNHSPVFLDSLNIWLQDAMETEEFKKAYRKYYQ